MARTNSISISMTKTAIALQTNPTTMGGDPMGEAIEKSPQILLTIPEDHMAEANTENQRGQGAGDPETSKDTKIERSPIGPMAEGRGIRSRSNSHTDLVREIRMSREGQIIGGVEIFQC